MLVSLRGVCAHSFTQADVLRGVGDLDNHEPKAWPGRRGGA